MTEGKRKEMAALVDTFDDQYRKGNMPSDLYCRSMVICAHEYIAEGEAKLAIDLLRRCPSTYFDGAFRQQMEEDERFESLSFEVATAIDRAGLTKELNATLTFTQHGLGRA